MAVFFSSQEELFCAVNRAQQPFMKNVCVYRGQKGAGTVQIVPPENDPCTGISSGSSWETIGGSFVLCQYRCVRSGKRTKWLAGLIWEIANCCRSIQGWKQLMFLIKGEEGFSKALAESNQNQNLSHHLQCCDSLQASTCTTSEKANAKLLCVEYLFKECLFLYLFYLSI